MTDKVLFSSQSQEWATPADLFDELDKEFHFNLDPCATIENRKCDRFFSKAEDGLKQDWGGVYRLLQSTLWPSEYRRLDSQVC